MFVSILASIMALGQMLTPTPTPGDCCPMAGLGAVVDDECQ